MCGLVGILGPRLDVGKYRIFQELMTVATVRGNDGAGLLAVPVKGKKPVEVMRDNTICAAELVFGYDFYGLIKNCEPACLMGHARQPTKGGRELEDCHPHTVGDIIGMHNGTMDWIGDKAIKDKDNDSLLLYQSIAKRGIEDTMKNSLGAYALSYINRATDTLYFLRNSQRPLWFAQYQDEPKFLYWASEPGMLEFVLKRHKPTTALRYFKLPENELVSFRLHSTEDIKPLEKKDISRPAVVVNPPTGPRLYPTKHPHVIDQHDLMKCLASGCSYCTGSADMGDYDNKKITFYSRDEFICNECLALDETARDYIRSCGVEVPADVIPVPTHH